jgi:hypothetical protein
LIAYITSKGSNPQNMSGSRSLSDYAAMVAKIRECQANSQSLGEAIAKAVLYCKKHGIMKDFLQKYKSEVPNMLNADFGLSDMLTLKFEEGREEGREEGLEKGWEKCARAVAELIGKGYSVNEALGVVSDKRKIIM